MKGKLKKWLLPTAFIVGGAVIGLAYFFLAGCATGNCAITSNPFTLMAYMGIIGWLLSGVFGGECESG